MLEHVPDDARLRRRAGARDPARRHAGREHAPSRRDTALRRLRHALGQTDEKHGHLRPGYDAEELRALLAPAFALERWHTYSRFFSELVDTGIQWGVERLGKKPASKGLVVTGGDIARHRRLFRAYSVVYPLVWTVSRLDALLPASSGYMLIASAVRHELRAPRRFGRYVVEQEIGDGAMGRVYRCSDPLMKRLVAVKTVKQEYLTRETRRGLPAAVPPRGPGRGPPLPPEHRRASSTSARRTSSWSTSRARRCRRSSRERGKLPAGRGARPPRPRSRTPSTTRTAPSIVHRDIKPANIMVLDGRAPEAHGLRRGAAGVVGRRRPRATSSDRRPTWRRSRSRAAEVTNRADLFSFAVLAYEVITGRRPFEGDSITAVMYRVVNEDRAPAAPMGLRAARELRRDLPARAQQGPGRPLSGRGVAGGGAAAEGHRLRAGRADGVVAPDAAGPARSHPPAPSSMPPGARGDARTSRTTAAAPAERRGAAKRRGRGWRGPRSSPWPPPASTYLRGSPARRPSPRPFASAAGPATFRVEAEPPGARGLGGRGGRRPGPHRAAGLRRPPQGAGRGGRLRARRAEPRHRRRHRSRAATVRPGAGERAPVRHLRAGRARRCAWTAEASGCADRPPRPSLPAATKCGSRRRGFAPSVQRIEGTAGETVEVTARLTRLSAAPGPPQPVPSPEWIPSEGDLVRVRRIGLAAAQDLGERAALPGRGAPREPPRHGEGRDDRQREGRAHRPPGGRIRGRDPRPGRGQRGADVALRARDRRAVSR